MTGVQTCALPIYFALLVLRKDTPANGTLRWRELALRFITAFYKQNDDDEICERKSCNKAGRRQYAVAVMGKGVVHERRVVISTRTARRASRRRPALRNSQRRMCGRIRPTPDLQVSRMRQGSLRSTWLRAQRVRTCQGRSCRLASCWCGLGRGRKVERATDGRSTEGLVLTGQNTGGTGTRGSRPVLARRRRRC